MNIKAGTPWILMCIAAIAERWLYTIGAILAGIRK